MVDNPVLLFCIISVDDNGTLMAGALRQWLASVAFSVCCSFCVWLDIVSDAVSASIKLLKLVISKFNVKETSGPTLPFYPSVSWSFDFPLDFAVSC